MNFGGLVKKIWWKKYVLICIIMSFAFSLFFLFSVWEFDPDFHGFFDYFSRMDGQWKWKQLSQIYSEAPDNFPALRYLVWFTFIWTIIPAIILMIIGFFISSLSNLKMG